MKYLRCRALVLLLFLCRGLLLGLGRYVRIRLCRQHPAQYVIMDEVAQFKKEVMALVDDEMALVASSAWTAWAEDMEGPIGPAKECLAEMLAVSSPEAITKLILLLESLPQYHASVEGSS